MTINISKKRAAPVEIEPVIYKRIKYTVPHFTVFTKDMEHNGGYVEATDIKTNKRIWLKEIYKPKIDTNLEKDVQDVFITSMVIEGNKLVVINEKYEKYEILLE